MLTLTCTKCGATMEVDDGFAGGACRCGACGTIQTVPARDAGVRDRLRGGQCLFERTGDVTAASIVPRPATDALGGPSPGGASLLDPDRPRPPRATRPPRPAVSPPRRAWPATLLVAIAGTVAVTIAILLMRSLDPATHLSGDAPAPEPVTRRTDPAAPLTGGPRFGPIRLDREGPIVYLLDRDAATNVPFAPALYRAVVASIESLPSDRSATVRFFAADDGSPSREATTLDAVALSRWMADVTTRPATDAIGSLEATLEREPAEVVLVTGRGWRLEPAFAEQATAIVRGRASRIHTVSLGTADATGPLATLAAATGGEAIALTVEDLARLAGAGRSASTMP